MDNILKEILQERLRQIAKWGGAEHDDNHTVRDFVEWIEDYAGWARMRASCYDLPDARDKLVKVAALAVACIEGIDRKL